MLNRTRTLFTVLAALLVLGIGIGTPGSAPGQAATSIEGNWLGSLTAAGFQYRIAVQFKKKSTAGYTGTFQSLDQGAQVLPLDVVTLAGSSLHFELRAAHGTWDGKVNDKGELEGKWSQGGAVLPLIFKHAAAPTVVRRPQEPKKPYPYTEEEVLYDNKLAGTKIGGTLTLPKEKGPFPAVLLITGSGQQNRNEELLGHKPFLIIADYLTRRGIAVLRVDDRGMGKSTGDFAKATTADFATDVEAGIAFLKARSDVRHDKIGLIGHSEGGVIAPMVAARNKDVAFIVMLAGTGVDGGKILTAQGELIAKAAGASDAAINENREIQEKLFAVIKADSNPASAEVKLNTIVKDMLSKMPAAQRAALTPQLTASAKSVNGPWLRFFITYDPAPALTKVKCPVLAINGEKDLQVPPKLNLPAIEAALKAGGNKDYTVKLMPGMNHLFQECTTGSPSEYSKIEQTMSPAALQTMGDWIAAHCAH